VGVGRCVLLTADGFDNLRALIDPSAAPGKAVDELHGRATVPAAWSLLYSGEVTDRNVALEQSAGCCCVAYGIVFREVLTRESILPKWREV